MAEAFVHMTGLDPTSIYSRQSPQPRQRPPSYGAAPDDRPPPPPTLWACAKQVALRAASWLYHRTVRFCLG